MCVFVFGNWNCGLITFNFFCRDSTDTSCMVSWGNTCIHVVHVGWSVSVIQVLFLPCGGGDGAVRVHDDLGAADDHCHQQQAEERDAGQSQALVHVHEGWLCGALHLHDCCCLLLLSSHPATILKTQLETHTEGEDGSVLSSSRQTDDITKLASCRGHIHATVLHVYL